MAKLSKRQKSINELLEQGKTYLPSEAIAKLKTLPAPKFDQTVEIAFRLGINPKHADQQIRTTTSLPGGTGKDVRIAVVAKGEVEKSAIEAGADFAGFDDIIAKIQGGWMEFDVLLATPDVMPALARLGKVLGPRGLMPNLKTGTVLPAEQLARGIKEFKAGKIEVRN
ncbi:MAG: 50S ribosomal protein L1, partial [Candidatus Sericytochromatia bacterium]|nr:50S ribosomal protein L1 [Candidatus Sericytochromatia bacterium]